MRRLSFLFLVVCWLSLPVAVSAQPSDSLPIAGYWEQISQFHSQLKDLPEEDEAAYDDWLATTALQLSAIESVVLEDGRLLPLNHTPLITLLESNPPPDKTLVEGRLEALIIAETGRFETKTNDTSLQTVLADGRFVYGEEPPVPRWRQWLNDLLLRILEIFFRGGSFVFNDVTGTILSVLSVLVMIGVFIYVLRHFRGNFIPEAMLEDELAEDTPLNANMALERAHTLSMGGDYRTAVRYLYLSSLLILEERGLLRYNRSLTNREYLKAIAHHPDLLKRLQPVIDVFDRVWYGYQPLSKEEYTQYQQWVEGLRNTDS